MNITSGVIALVTAAAAFGIGAFARPAGAATPPAEIFPLFAVLLLLESVALGAGVAYLIRGGRKLLDPATAPLERALVGSVAYLLLAPWVHDYFHALTLINGVFNWPALAGIEYVFHLGVVPVGLLVAAYVARTRALRPPRGARSGP